MRERMDRMQSEFNRFVEMLRDYAAQQSNPPPGQTMNEGLVLNRPPLFSPPVTDRERPGLQEYDGEEPSEVGTD